MIRNYFKTAYRALLRNKGFTLINICGLATGIGICTIIFVVIQYQSSFDNFHPNKARIYRVLTEYHHADSKTIFYGSGVPFGLPKGLQTSLPQIVKLAPILADHDVQLVTLNNNQGIDKKFKEANGFFYTTPDFFYIFNFPNIKY